MYSVFRPAVVLVVLLVAGCSVFSVDHSPVVIKSENDQKQYRYLTLPNQLRVLLVSDPEADKSAASLDIFVGSGQDPADYQGLAHFLEHMLFLGTEKYPQAGEYQAFLSAHGGSYNAYTAFEHTNYFFDVDPAHLEAALDRFAQFFIKPLFLEAYVDREKNAVHSEYLAKIKNDHRKALDVFKSVVNPEHPFAKFSVGNLDTLNAVDNAALQSALLQFYRQYYSANIMTLAVVGRESLIELESMVRLRFSTIADKNISVQSIDTPLFKDNQLPQVVKIRPEKDQKKLSLAFPIPSVTPYWQQKPVKYLGNIIGHEGEGSLLSFLKQRGWAESLSAGGGLSYQGGAIFNVTINLTTRGIDHTDEIIKAVFQTINRIKAEDMPRWLFDEQRAIANMQFRYQEDITPIYLASQLSRDMHYFPPRFVLSGNYKMDDYDKDLIKRFVDKLSPDNVLITISAPGLDVNRKTGFYRAQYSVQPVSSEQLTAWHAAGVDPLITLPVKNEFIASDFDVIRDAVAADAVPELIHDTDNTRLWYLQDERFNLPKGSTYFSLNSAMANNSAENAVRLRLLAALITESLNEFSYPAMLSGLNYSINSTMRGLLVKINGFTDKQSLMLDKIIQAIRAENFDPQQFNTIKQRLIRRLENKRKQQPYRLAFDGLSEILYRDYWTVEQMLSAFNAVSLDDVQRYAGEYLSTITVESLVFGNYSLAEAKAIAGQLQQHFGERSQRPQPSLMHITQLPGAESSLQVESDYSDAAVIFYLQSRGAGTETGVADKQSRVAMAMTAQILQTDFFEQLRTEKQLGYVVFSGVYPLFDVPGIYFAIQSPVAGARELQQQINQFLQARLESLDQMPVSAFERYRNSLLQRLSERPKNLPEQAGEFWGDIAQNYDQFDLKQQLISTLRSLSFAQWKAYFKRDIVSADRRGLWIYSPGKFAEQPEVPQPVTNSQAFKASRSFYVFD